MSDPSDDLPEASATPVGARLAMARATAERRRRRLVVASVVAVVVVLGAMVIYWNMWTDDLRCPGHRLSAIEADEPLPDC